MGALDHIHGPLRCPRCGAVHTVTIQTKQFAPQYGRLHDRWFAPSSPQPIDFDPVALCKSEVWEDEWHRVRRADPASVTFLMGADDSITCSCGCPFATAATFHLEHGQATLRTLTPWPHQPTVDFVCLDATPQRDPVVEARQALHDAARHMAQPLGTWIVTPTRCNACGDVRERRIPTAFTPLDGGPPFLGGTWPRGATEGGEFAPGRAAGDPSDGGPLSLAGTTLDPALSPAIGDFEGALYCGDEVRVSDWDEHGAYCRLQPTHARAESLCVLQDRQAWSCACGAGPVTPCQIFDRVTGAIVLVRQELRVLRHADDLADVDFAPTPPNATPETCWQAVITHLTRGPVSI